MSQYCNENHIQSEMELSDSQQQLHHQQECFSREATALSHAEVNTDVTAPIKLEETVSSQSACDSFDSSELSLSQSEAQSASSSSASSSSAVAILSPHQINFKFASAVGRMLSITQNHPWRDRILASLECRDVAEAEEKLQLLAQFIQQSYQAQRTPRQQRQTIRFPTLPACLASLFTDVLTDSQPQGKKFKHEQSKPKLNHKFEETEEQTLKRRYRLKQQDSAEPHIKHVHVSPYFARDAEVEADFESAASAGSPDQQEQFSSMIKSEISAFIEEKHMETADSLENSSVRSIDMSELPSIEKPKISIAELLAGRL